METSIPSHKFGNESNTEHTISLQNSGVARQVFNEASARLFDVNKWHTFTEPKFSTFQLTTLRGELYRGPVNENLLIKIRIPAPGLKKGEGFDWVKVEEVKYLMTGDSLETIVRVRPVASPHQPFKGVAHFFKEDATTTFKIRWAGTTVTAGVYGRNEVPNVHNLFSLDGLRNLVVATTAMFLGSKLQWKNLAVGLLRR